MAYASAQSQDFLDVGSADPFMAAPAAAQQLLKKRVAPRQQLYQALDKTTELAEVQYYGTTLATSVPSLIQPNEFWSDLAAHLSSDPASRGPFLSKHVLLACRNANEVLMAVAVMDLPLTSAAPPAIAVDEGKLVFTASSPMLVYFKDTVSVEVVAGAPSSVLVGQQYFDPRDRTKQHRGSTVDKFLASPEFLYQKVYGCQVVITNMSSGALSLDVLLQVPQGSVPVANGSVLSSQQVDLTAYATKKIEYFFYFPATGRFDHFPVHVAQDEALEAFASPAVLTVVQRPSVVDGLSWEYLSQQADLDQLIAYIDTANLAGLSLRKLCWRLCEPIAYHRVVAVLRSRLVFDDEVWAYGLLHGDAVAVRELMSKHLNRLPSLSPAFSSALITVSNEALLGPDAVSADVVAHPLDAYEHTEFEPLVNARAHVLGKSRQILNNRANAQYRKLLVGLCHKPAAAVSPNDLLAVTYHLLLQDRVEDALTTFAGVPRPPLPECWSSLQYQYLAAYLDFYSPEGPAAAGAIAAQFVSFPVPKWAQCFQDMLDQLHEATVGVAAAAPGAEGDVSMAAAGDGSGVPSSRDRAKRMDGFASQEPSLSMSVEAQCVNVTYTNLTSLSLRFYPMDIELLFSNSPFLVADSTSSSVGDFGYIRPSCVLALDLPAYPSGGVGEHSVPLPAHFNAANVMVEATAGALKCSQAYYSNSLRVQLLEAYGQVKVVSVATGLPLSRVYVKVYSRRSVGETGAFYKDGYTDVRGRFDYASISTDELGKVERFGVLVCSDSQGAVVLQARPPRA